MIRRYSPIRLLVLIGLLVAATQLALAQSRAIRPVTIQIPDGEQVELYKGSYALVIGASDYQDNSWGDLSSVREDVKAVREALEEQGFQVDTLLDPTEDALIDEINDFIDAHGYEQDNRLLFYYSGHGYTQERNGRKFGYLVPIDAPNPYDNEREFFRKSVKMEQVLSWAKQIESKHALFVFDSCFSGSVLQSRAVAVPEDISYLTAKPVRQFISAGSANQTVPAISVFRPLFIRGINCQADLDKDGYVTGNELGMYLQKQVPQYQTGQTPQYGKILDPYLDEGNFVFEVKRQKPKHQIQSAPPAVSSVELGDLQEQADAAEQARLEQQRIKAQWQEWQQRMQKDYDMVTAFEQQAIENKLKVESWERFLSIWKDDNPYSEQDKELRSKAQSRITYWQKEIQEQKTEQQYVQPQEKKLDVVLRSTDALKHLKATNSCESCDLQNANLYRENLESINLRKANLTNASFWKANLKFAKLNGANLRKANLWEADLRRANLQNANLTGADLHGADLWLANLQNANLTGANLWSRSDFYITRLRGANLQGVNLTDANLRGVDLTEADLTEAIFCRTKMPSGSINNRDC